MSRHPVTGPRSSRLRVYPVNASDYDETRFKKKFRRKMHPHMARFYLARYGNQSLRKRLQQIQENKSVQVFFDFEHVPRALPKWNWFYVYVKVWEPLRPQMASQSNGGLYLFYDPSKRELHSGIDPDWSFHVDTYCTVERNPRFLTYKDRDRVIVDSLHRVISVPKSKKLTNFFQSELGRFLTEVEHVVFTPNPFQAFQQHVASVIKPLTLMDSPSKTKPDA